MSKVTSNLPPTSYNEFVLREAVAVRNAHVKRNKRYKLNESDLYHCAWRRLIELWTARDIIHDIIGEPVQDGGAGGGAIEVVSEDKPSGESGFLSVRGTEIVDENGQPWPLVGFSSHLLMCQIKKGKDVSGLLDSIVDYGYNTIIVIGSHLSSWKKDHGFLLDPRDSGHMDLQRALYDIAAEKKLRVWYRALADAQDLSQSVQTRVWEQAADVARGRWNAVLTIGNEGNTDGGSNGWNPANFNKPGDMQGVLCTRGSQGGDQVPYTPVWDIAEFESRRDLPKALTDAGCVELYYGGWDKLPRGIDKPIVNIEPIFFHDATRDKWGDERSNNPNLARQLGGMIGANCSGGGFGASDGLEAEPLGPIAELCAREFARGLRGAFVR